MRGASPQLAVPAKAPLPTLRTTIHVGRAVARYFFISLK
jgi:hypothetical protein